MVDSVFLALGHHSRSERLFFTWCCIQGVACILAGALQGIRRRGWWEVFLVGVIAAGLLALIVLIIADPDPGSADCPGQSPCDTAFGFGAVFIVVLTTPIFSGIACLGRGLGGLVAREVAPTV